MANISKIKLPGDDTEYNVKDTVSGYTTNTGTVTGVKINGTTKTPSSGVVDIGTVATSNTTYAAGTGVTISGTNNAINVTYGSSANTACQGNDSRLSNARPSSDVVQTYSSTSTVPISGQGVAAALATLPSPMVFKGSLGTNGTITALPTNGSATVGDTYKVITAGTYASQAAKVGDAFICDSKTSSANTWVLIPSGDEPSGTVTSITIGATSPIAIDNSGAITTSGSRTISHANSGVTAGTYQSVTVNATGHVTSGAALTKAQVTTALGYTPPTSDTNTHRPIQMNGTEILGNNTTALNLKAGTNVTLSNDSGTVTITSTDTNTWRPVSDSVSSTSSSDAASSKAVKTAYDLAASKTSNTGTVTSVAASGSGGISISGSPITTSGTITIGVNGSTVINNLTAGDSNAQRTDYIVAQYAGGGTTTTTYHRRPLSKIFAALNSSDITTALGYTPYNSTNPNGYTSNTGTITSVKTTAGAHTAINVSSGAANFNVPTKTSHLTNDSGFLTSHQDISGKADKSATVSNVAYDTTNAKFTKTINGTTSDIAKLATTSVGSASAGTAIAADDITGWTTNTPTAVTPNTVVTGGTTTDVPNISKKTVVTGVTKKTVVTSASGATATVSGCTLTLTNGSFSTGDSCTVTTGDSVTVGTAIKAYTSLTTGAACSVTAGTAASLSYTARSIPNISVSSKTVATGFTTS